MAPIGRFSVQLFGQEQAVICRKSLRLEGFEPPTYGSVGEPKPPSVGTETRFMSTVYAMTCQVASACE
jgi:hypothetical protein